MWSFSKFSSRSFDWPLLAAVLLLCALGLAATYSVDLSRGTELIYFHKQLLALGIGLVLFVGASLAQPNLFRVMAKPAYVVSLLLLLLVLLFGSTIRGTRGWFTLGSFSFQPVEAVKLGAVLIMAYVVANFGRRFERPLFFYGTGALVGILVGLVLLQPDLGSAVVVGMLWLGLMFLVKARPLHLGILGVILAVVAVGSWFFLLQDYQKERLYTFINPERDPLGAGYNVTQAVIAVGSGQWFGRGLGFGSQSQLRFLPEAQTDFIFSVISEELGFAGTAVLIVLFGLILWRLIGIVKRTDDDFAAAVVAGAAILVATQLFVNVGANLGLLPITGVTLPFVSYGGSSLTMNLLLMGIVESMVVRRY